MKEENLIGNSKVATDFLGNVWHYDCMGCSIEKGNVKIPGGVIYKGKYSNLGADPEVPIPGFLILSSRRHVNSFSEMTKEEREEVSNIIYHTEKALKELGIAEKVSIVQEEVSRHFHVWIFPNYPWMLEKFGKGISYFNDIASYAIENANEETIKEIMEVVEKVKKYFSEVKIN